MVLDTLTNMWFSNNPKLTDNKPVYDFLCNELKKLGKSGLSTDTSKEELRELIVKFILNKKDTKTLSSLFISIHFLLMDEENNNFDHYCWGVSYEGDLNVDCSTGIFFNKLMEQKEALQSTDYTDIKKIATYSFEKALEICMNPQEYSMKQKNFVVNNDVLNNNVILAKGIMVTEQLVGTAVYFLKYLEFTKTLKVTVQKQRVIDNTKRNNNKKAKDKKNAIRFKTIETKSISYSLPKKLNSEDVKVGMEDMQRNVTYMLANWTVRGHWRTYKDGTRRWIKPQIRRRAALNEGEETGKNFYSDFNTITNN